eukprot:TRINITY_DN2401_c0_g1_i1.p1 TRINITY_DN2401_c0_g1~~TRINITY_DN2401_c0_g1_i1.p1  ORF type:complete len:290 (+),score=48.41 TRINITY_DN2401_c0_g1_i1:102-971(+)
MTTSTSVFFLNFFLCFLVLSFSFALNNRQTHELTCSDVEQAASVVLYPSSSLELINAGETRTFPMSLRVAYQPGFPEYMESFTVRFTPVQDQREVYQSSASAIFLFDESVAFNSTFFPNLTLTPDHNTIGAYRVQPTMSLRLPSQFCLFSVTIKSPFELVVLNDEKQADVLPPQLLHIQLDKSEYRVGENIKITFVAIDKSPLKVESGHVSFTSETDKKSIIDKFPAVYQQLGDSSYSTEVQIPAQLPPSFTFGFFSLTTLKLFDKFDNGGSKVPSPLSKVVRFKLLQN